VMMSGQRVKVRWNDVMMNLGDMEATWDGHYDIS
jgi:hypothetical protein